MTIETQRFEVNEMKSIGYDINGDGTIEELELVRGVLDSTKVIVFIDDESKYIFLWKGKDVDVRKRFVGARVASNIRSRIGFHYKVRPEDEGEESVLFFRFLKSNDLM